jgi:hypothetical protein
MRSPRAVAGAVVFLTLAALAATCSAAIPRTMNYQVMLTDDLDQPLADQSVQLVFRIFGQESGGGELWSEVHNVTTNSIGVASVVLGSAYPLSIDFSVPRWLQVEADGEVLLPRRPLTSAPYVLHDEVGGAGDGYSLDAVDGSPVDAVYVDDEGRVGVGTTSPEAELHVRQELQVGSTGRNGTLRVESDARDASVDLPEEAIDALETLDEPGIASAASPGVYNFTGSIQSVCIRSLTAPADGYIFAEGTVEVRINHVHGTDSTIYVGLTDDFPNYPAPMPFIEKIDYSAPTGEYFRAVTVSGVFTAYAGLTKTIRIACRRFQGSTGSIVGENLTLLYFPTAYGTVETIDAKKAAPEPAASLGE